MKKGLAWVCCAALLFTALFCGTVAAEENASGGNVMISEWNGVVPTYDFSYSFSGGDGSQNAPYLISSAADLAMLAANVRGTRSAGIDGYQFLSYTGKHFRLTVDIDLKGHEWYGIGGALPTAGFGDYSFFAGIFDGNDHKIHNLNLAFYDPSLEKTLNFQGLFGYITNGAEIRNLGIAGGNITDSNDYRVTRVGCLVGGARKDAVIENCYNNADLRVCGMSGSANYIGGLIGTWMDGSQNRVIRNCYNTGDVTVVVGHKQFRVGGIVGGILGAGPSGCTYLFENCFNTGNITVEDNGTDFSGLTESSAGSRAVAGIAGAICDGALMINCHSSGSITYRYVGTGVGTDYNYCTAFVGFINARLKNCTAVLNGLKAIGRNQDTATEACKGVTSVPFYLGENGFLDISESVSYDFESGNVIVTSKIGSHTEYQLVKNKTDAAYFFDFENNAQKHNFGVSLKLSDPFGLRITARLTDQKGANSSYAAYLSGIQYGFFVLETKGGEAPTLQTPQELINSDSEYKINGGIYGESGYYFADIGSLSAHQLNTTFQIVCYYISGNQICLSDVVSIRLEDTLKAYATEGNPYHFAENEYQVYVAMLEYAKQYANYME